MEWVSQQHVDEPRDQQCDLFGPFWAEVGPDQQGWSWAVLDFDRDNMEVAHGVADSEAAAKAAVDEWERSAKPMHEWIVTGTSMVVEAPTEQEACERAQDMSGWSWEASEVNARQPEPVIYKYADLSTAHLPQTEFESIAAAPARVIEHEYGAFVNVLIYESLHDGDWSLYPALREVMEWARQRNVRWVNFDQDGDTTEELTTWEW